MNIKKTKKQDPSKRRERKKHTVYTKKNEVEEEKWLMISPGIGEKEEDTRN